MSGYAPPPPDRGSWTGERRVTVDLDDAVPMDVVRAWHYLRDAGAHEVEARTSASGEGFHVRAWFDAGEVDPSDVEVLRLAAGDHPRRTAMDREHHVKPGQVLFSRKGVPVPEGHASKPPREAGPWHANPWDAADELRARSRRYGLASWRPL